MGVLHMVLAGGCVLLMSGIVPHYFCYMVHVVHSFHGEYMHETRTYLSVPTSKWLCTPLFLVKTKFYLKTRT